MSRRRPDSDEVSDQLAAIVRQANLPRVAEKLTQRAGTGLDRAAFAILARLEEAELRVGELAELLSIDVSTASRQASALVDRGLAERFPHPSDRRGTILRATDAGRATLDRHREARRDLVAELLAEVPDDELAVAASVLGRFAAGLESLVTDDGSPPGSG